jgi:hypothetical protein
MTETMRVSVTVRWYTAEEGGRRTGPPPGPKYTPTARFSDQPLEDMFSVILVVPASTAEDRPLRTTGELTPEFPEHVPDFADRLTRGEVLMLHEGARVVAECVAPSPQRTAS